MMAHRSPKVSVCIPAYNRQSEVIHALSSVLNQDFDDFEVLVLDDGSTDQTRMVAEQFDDPRVRVEANPRNLGIPSSRNRCLELARGEYIAWLDSDDLMSPKRLSHQVHYLDRNPSIATLGGWVRTFDNDSNSGKLLIKPTQNEYLRAWLLFRCCHANTTLMGRTSVMRKLAYRTNFPVSEDYDFSVRLTEHHRVANLPQILTRQRQHLGRTTRASIDMNFTTKTTLFHMLLQRIGLDVKEQDLAFHYSLTRLTSEEVKKENFVDRTADWLRALEAANHRSKYLERDSFADVLQLVWAQCCLKRAKEEGVINGLRSYNHFQNDGRLMRMIGNIWKFY